MIEQVLIKKTLKAGDTVWEEGRIENSPLPDTLLDEIRLETGTVEVLKRSKPNPSDKLVFVARKVEEGNGGATTTSQFKTESKNVTAKPKLKLRRRKR